MDELILLLGPLNETYKHKAGKILSAHHGDVHAARNLFFRRLFTGLSPAKPGSVIDSVADEHMPKCKDLKCLYRLVPRRRQQVVNEADVNTSTRSEANSNSEAVFAKISQDLICRIMSFCELSEISSMCLVNRNFSQHMKSNEIWYTLCKQYWTLPVSRNRDGKYIDWKNTFRQFFKFMSTLCCPENSCMNKNENGTKTNVVVPIVYGFPSRELVEAMRENRLILGDDHIIEGRSVWYCYSCKTNWTHWPYTHLPKELCVS